MLPEFFVEINSWNENDDVQVTILDFLLTLFLNFLMNSSFFLSTLFRHVVYSI